MIEPGTGTFPLACDGGARDGHRVGHFLLRQATEVSQLHDATLTSVKRRQLAQGFVEHQDVEAGGLRRRNLIVEIDAPSCSGALGCPVFTSVVNENAPHHLRGHRVEVPAVLPGDAVATSESQKRFVNQRRGLQRVIGAFVTQITGRAFAQLVIDQRHEFIAGAQIPSGPRMQELADRADAVAHATAFGAYSMAW